MMGAEFTIDEFADAVAHSTFEPTPEMLAEDWSETMAVQGVPATDKPRRAILVDMPFLWIEMFMANLARGMVIVYPKASNLCINAKVTGIWASNETAMLAVRLESDNFDMVPAGHPIPEMGVKLETYDTQEFNSTLNALNALNDENQFIRMLLTDKAKEKDVAASAIVVSVDNKLREIESLLESQGMADAAKVVRAHREGSES